MGWGHAFHSVGHAISGAAKSVGNVAKKAAPYTPEGQAWGMFRGARTGGLQGMIGANLGTKYGMQLLGMGGLTGDNQFSSGEPTPYQPKLKDLARSRAAGSGTFNYTDQQYV